MRGEREVETLVLNNQGLVPYIMRNHFNIEQYDEDMFQCGMIGLWKAAKTWDESKSRFATYACRCITNEILMYLRCKTNRSTSDTSLDNPISPDSDIEFKDLIPCDDDPFEVIELREVIVQLKQNLAPRELKVLELSMRGANQSTIAKRVGCTQSYVSRLKKQIKEKLRGMLYASEM